ncbi:PREDICTED: MATH domain and coiled-coil domain-containing protein At2g42470-like [Camelina sativa]|uniref:MATH domain and coiled-coil domain-containing protein At2g42470-like n=1 Tax=Camelina sativa TaxID=90675 RepID=A0ABM0SZA1_CAMSA|nr:PREDICTED: MATH domain and coiled-coil domain-containing protein At2g42470-like [Camelina sativa]
MGENQKETSFTFEIDNFWEKGAAVIRFVKVYPKGYGDFKDHLSVHFCVARPRSLKVGWKRRANLSLLLLNQSGKELYRSPNDCNLFCAQFSRWGTDSRFLPLKKLREEGLLENKLIVQVEIKLVEIVDQEDATDKDMLDVHGFQLLDSQVTSASRLFEDHPDIAVNFIPKIALVKTAYVSALLGLIKTLNKPPHSFTETELKKAKRELNELTRAGFKLDWLDTKLDELSFDDKDQKAISYVDPLDDWIKFLFVDYSWNEWKILPPIHEVQNKGIILEMSLEDRNCGEDKCS